MGDVVVVTGAGRGIGAACARAAAKAGWKVAVNYANSRDAALAVVADIERDGGVAVAIRADVARQDEVARLFAETDRLLGPVTGLVANAGIGGTIAPIVDQTAATLEPLFATNVWGVMYCVGEATRRMSTRHGGPGGSIVVISSAAARLGGLPGMVAYAASKGAVDSMTVGLAKELGRDGIRVNAIRPGLIDTDIIAHAGGQAFLAQVAPSIPMGRAGQPIEIGEAAAWLLSPAASYVHGAVLDVSGGR
ncbi:MAG: SDR family oxidoreductase [Burkholderiales bacterium]|nr:MAG: SDR family oxidoreductase [Burkholderiales bacterium]